MIHCCTYFDVRYLTRALALYRSLECQGKSFHLWMLCLDDESFSMLGKLKLPHATPVSDEELQKHFPKLKTAQSNRSLYEYYVTTKSFLLRWIYDHHPEIDLLFLFDADFFFYADPLLLEKEAGTAAVLLTPHRLTPTSAGSKAGQHGTYNAGFVAFRKSAGGLEPLAWWCAKVLEWCRDEPQGELFADQGYLDLMIRQFSGVRTTQNPGINVAPWNVDERMITTTDGKLLAKDQPLLFYHFHGLRRLGPWIYDTGTAPYRIRPNAAVTRMTSAYVRELRQIHRWLRETYGYRIPEGSVRHSPASIFASPGLLISRILRRQWLIA